MVMMAVPTSSKIRGNSNNHFRYSRVSFLQPSQSDSELLSSKKKSRAVLLLLLPLLLILFFHISTTYHIDDDNNNSNDINPFTLTFLYFFGC